MSPEGGARANESMCMMRPNASNSIRRRRKSKWLNRLEGTNESVMVGRLRDLAQAKSSVRADRPE